MKFAAIDVGSNAVRLLLSRVIEDGHEPIIKKESLVRMPIRLGEDAFIRHRIEQMLEPRAAYLYIDVGGGCTELTLLQRGRSFASRSSQIHLGGPKPGAGASSRPRGCHRSGRGDLSFRPEMGRDQGHARSPDRLSRRDGENPV